MARFTNSSNSHVLNTFYFNAGQFRDCTVDVIDIQKRTFVNSSYLKKIFNYSTLKTESSVNTKSIRVKNLLIPIQSTISYLRCLCDLVRLRKIFLSIVPFKSTSSLSSTYVRLKNSTLSLYYTNNISSIIRISISPSFKLNSKTNLSYKVNRSCYTNISPLKNISSLDIDYFGFLIYYKGKIKTFICTKSAPHHPSFLTYKVRGKEYKERLPFNAFYLNSSLYNDGAWTTSSYHFDTTETIKENTILDIHEVKEPVVVECDNKHSLFFTPTTKSNKISFTPVVGKELKYDGHKIFE